MADVIGTPALRAEFDSRDLLKGARDAGIKLKTTFEESNRNVEAVQRNASRRIQGLISQINAEKPRRQMFELGQAVQHMGGLAQMSEGQVSRLRVQIERLTAAGAKAPKSLASLVPTTGSSTLGTLASAAGNQIGGNLAGGAGGLGGVLGTIGPAGLAAAAGIGAVATAAYASAAAIGDLAKRGSQLSDLSAKTQINVESLQRMEYAGSLVGVSIDTITNASLKLDRAMVNAPEKFAQLGLSVRDLMSMDPEQRFEAVSTALRGMPEGPTRTAAAFDILGKSAGEVLPYLTSNLANAHAEATRLGIVLDTETVAAADKLDDSLTRLDKSWSALKNQLAGVATGGGDAADAVNMLAEAVGTLGRFISENKDQLKLLGLIMPGPGSTFAGMEARTQLRTQFGGLGSAPDVGDTRKGSIFGPQGLVVPQGPSSAELERERQVDRDRVEATRLATEAEKKLADARRENAALAERLRFTGIGLENTRVTMEQDLTTRRDFKSTDLTAATEELNKFLGDGGPMQNVPLIAKQATEQTETLTDRLGSLADNLQLLAQTTGGLTGKIVGFAGSLVSGLGGAIQGFKQMMSGGGEKGFLGTLGKITGGIGMVGSAIGAGISLFKGVKSLFGGKSKEEKAAEAQAKKDAEKAKADAARQSRIDADNNLRQGLGTARSGAEALMARLAEGGLSKGLSAALQTIIGKVGDALLKSGMGILDGRLSGSKEFQGAQGAAGDVAQVMAGMRQAGMVDAGLMAATGGAAAEIQQQAIDAAKAAGLSDTEAAKAGSAAISGILREQLNASLQSGKELDENTKQLLKTAEENGISILADPAIESLDVQKEQLKVLETIAGQKGGKATGAAGGLGPMMTRDLGGGLGPLIQTHPGELVWVLPKALARGGIISASRGIYEGGPDPSDTGGYGSDGGSTAGSANGPAGGTAAPSLEAIVAAVAEAVQKTSKPQVNLSVTQQVTESPFASAESKSEARAFTIEAAADALAANSGRFAQEIDRRIAARMATLR